MTKAKRSDPLSPTADAGAQFARLVETMRTLRSPGGCAWDREQTVASLRPFVLEEAYEVVEAMDRDDRAALCEELGDLLLEAVFVAQICAEDGDFNIADAAEAVTAKLVRRHPHVFGDGAAGDGIASGSTAAGDDAGGSGGHVAVGIGIGRFASYLPHIVMAGFLSGIGVRILWTQVAKVVPLGMDDAAIVGVSLAVMLLWPRKIEKYFPGPLAGVGSGILLSLFLPGAALLGELPTGLPVPVISIPSAGSLGSALHSAIVLALISTAYTLLFAITADTFTGGQHNSNRQLVSLGIANITAGFVGTMPGSGNLNTLTVIRFGGRTVMAGVITALLLAAALAFFGPYVSWVPLAALSAIILRVGIGLIEWRFLRRIFTIRKDFVAVMLITISVS